MDPNIRNYLAGLFVASKWRPNGKCAYHNKEQAKHNMEKNLQQSVIR